MKRVVFLAGLPGVGKSTLARRLAEQSGGLILDIDEIKKQVVDPLLVTSAIDPPEVRWKCYEKAAETIFELLASTDHVFVDEVFHLQSLRDNLENICTKQGLSVLWIEVRCPHEEVERRLKLKPREGHILTLEESLEMNTLFGEIFEAFPANKQNHLVFDNIDGASISHLA